MVEEDSVTDRRGARSASHEARPLSNRLGEVWRRKGSDLTFVVVASETSLGQSTIGFTSHACLILSAGDQYWREHVGKTHMLDERDRLWESDMDPDELMVGWDRTEERSR